MLDHCSTEEQFIASLMLAQNSRYHCVIIILPTTLKITVLQLAIFFFSSSQEQQFLLNTTTFLPIISPSQHLIILPPKVWETWHKFYVSLLEHVTTPHPSTMRLFDNRNWFISPNVKFEFWVFYRYLQCLYNFNPSWIHSFLTLALDGGDW